VNEFYKAKILKALAEKEPRSRNQICSLTGFSWREVETCMNFLTASGEVRKGYINQRGGWCVNGDAIADVGYSLP
jgi:hypothetical protein